MEVKITYIDNDKSRQQPGRIVAVYVRGVDDARVPRPGSAEAGGQVPKRGGGTKKSCMNTTDWIEVTEAQYQEILAGEWTVKNYNKLEREEEVVRKLAKIMRDNKGVEPDDLDAETKAKVEELKAKHDLYRTTCAEI